MARLLMLGGGPMQMPALRAAKRAGHQVATVDPNPRAPGFDVSDEAHVADLADEARCLDVALSFRPDGVMTFAADYPMPMVGKIARALGLPGPSLDSILAATDKSVMRRVLSDGAVPIPEWCVVYSEAETLEAMQGLQTDAVLKPARSSGGRGVTKLERDADRTTIREAFERARGVSPNDSSPLLLEAFVDGPEFSVEAISANGVTRILAVTDKATTGPPHFVEVGHRQPSALDEADRVRVEDVTKRSIAALGLNDTPSHTELRLGPSGPVVVEIASRCGGGYICSHLVPISTGVDMVGAAVSVALGLTPNLEPTESRGAAIAFVRAEPGTVDSIGDVDVARKMPGVVELEAPIHAGDPVPVLRDARDRLGYCICEAQDGFEAAARCQDAIAALSIQTKRNRA
ncbi:MAG: ATP-grasp domain-containing protein [Polyangiales bacterium]